MTALRWNNLLSEPAMGACQKQKSAAIRAPLPEDIGLFPGSSVVEQLTVNQLAAGSNPVSGAKKKHQMILVFFLCPVALDSNQE